MCATTLGAKNRYYRSFLLPDVLVELDATLFRFFSLTTDWMHEPCVLLLSVFFFFCGVVYFDCFL